MALFICHGRDIAAPILPWRTPHHPLESRAEGAFGFITERQGDGGNGFAGADIPASSQQTREIPSWQQTHPNLLADLDQPYYF